MSRRRGAAVMTPQELKRAAEMARNHLKFYRGEEKHFSVDDRGEWAMEYGDTASEQWALNALEGKCGDEAMVHAQLCAIASGRIVLGMGLPPVLGRYVCDVLEREYKRRLATVKGGRHPNELRDYWIATCVQTLLWEYPSLQATRSPATDGPSACSIVSEALNGAVGEKRIWEIWKAFTSAPVKGNNC